MGPHWTDQRPSAPATEQLGMLHRPRGKDGLASPLERIMFPPLQLTSDLGAGWRVEFIIILGMCIFEHLLNAGSTHSYLLAVVAQVWVCLPTQAVGLPGL